MADPRSFKDRGAWRRWLGQNHASQREQWVIFLKKHTGLQTFSYEDAVEEAICFGWIDGVMKRIDEATYQQRFTPRWPGGTWSRSNLMRARRMLDAGKMTAAGLEKLGDALERFETQGVAHTAPRAEALPEHLMALLEASDGARERFQKLAPSHRRQYLGWVIDARREETQERRMKEVVRVLSEGKKLGMK